MVRSTKGRDLFRRLFENMPLTALLWRLQSDGTIVVERANNQARRYHDSLGFKIEGRTLDELYAHIPLIYQMIKSSFNMSESQSLDVNFKSIVDGKEHYSRFQTVTLDDDLALLLITDLSKERATQEVLMRQKEELSRFDHHIAHDLRNMFQNILSITDMLYEHTRDELVLEITHIVERMNTILTRSLELADAGRVIGTPVRVPFEELVQEAMKSVLPDDVKVVWSNLPVIECDATRVIQMLQNLFVNAIEHGNAKTINITATQDDNGGMSILLSNDGAPITPEYRSKLFNTAFSSKPGGGRGLMIVKRIAEAHGWEIELLPDDKTTFRIKIPSQSSASSARSQ